MKKIGFIGVIGVIAFVVIAFVGCNSAVVRTKENVADFRISASQDLFSVADIYYNYTEKNGTSSNTTVFTQKMTESIATFRYEGEEDEIGLEIVAKLKDSYIPKDEYNLKFDLETILKPKDSDSSLTNGKTKNITIDELKNSGEVVFRFYYRMDRDSPVLVEE